MAATETTSGFLDLTLRRFRRAWRLTGKKTLKKGVAPDLSAGDVRRLRRQIDACLQTRGGEVSARTRAAELGEIYLVLDATGRRRFLELLARDYELDAAAVDEAIALRTHARDERGRRLAEARLREALVPPRVRLLRQFNDLSAGVKFLVDMRAELMSFAREDAGLQAFDADLRSLLASWFDVGFLELKRITWGSPASLLEKLIRYEAVHAIRSWDDLKHRLEGARRCYAFFHPLMPDEPLIFVQVALVDGMASSLPRLLDEEAPAGDSEQGDTAVFYSISNCQRGLSGVSFGSFLIKRVIDDLVRDHVNLKTFATLSPVPGFRPWLDSRLAAGDEPLLDEGEKARILALTGGDDPIQALRAVLEDSGWWKDPTRCETLKPVLERLCTRYLLATGVEGRARDRVAHFHLTNGARLERINWMADPSSQGVRQSAGIMVNYRYKLADIERNHEAYTGDGRVATVPSVRKLLK